MTQVEKGKFCSACQKTVFDFTNKSDREIINTFNSNEKLCGRFLNTQLNRDIAIPKEKKSIWLASIFFGTLTFLSTKIQAQEKPTIIQTETKPDIQGKIAIAKDTIKEKTITGVVSDHSGPIPGVNVINKTKNRLATTDFDGKYTIVADKDDIIEFSFLGFHPVTKKVNSSNFINIKLIDTVRLTGEVVFVKKRNFFGRSFRRIGNWFR